MIPASGLSGHIMAVLGLGRTGLATARALSAGGAVPFVWDDDAGQREAAVAEGLALRDPARRGALEGVAALIVSPGIPHLYPAPHPAVAAAWAAGIPVDNDIGLFFRSLAAPGAAALDTPPRVIAVTGSNGKSTTAALIHHVLGGAGRSSQLAGNIGRPALDIDPPGEGGIVVLELSSYQIELARALTPDIAVLTNIAPDHLDRHGGRGGYFAAKRRLFAEGGPDRAIVCVDEDEGRFLANQMADVPGDPRLIRVSSGTRLAGPGWSVFARKGFLAEHRKSRQVASIDLRAMPALPGAHNHQNACAAYAATRALGVAPRPIEAAMASFAGLPHRSQPIAEANGVRFVDDSKATNPHAAAAALTAHERVVWVAGGLLKGATVDELVEQAGPRLAGAVLLGTDREVIAAALRRHAPNLPVRAVDRGDDGAMVEVVAAAVELARPGDVVLLAPAAASMDMFTDYAHRGRAFAAAVAQLAARQGRGARA